MLLYIRERKGKKNGNHLYIIIFIKTHDIYDFFCLHLRAEGFVLV